MISSLPYAKHKYFYIFSRYSNLLADLLMMVFLIHEACMKVKRTKISWRFWTLMNVLKAKSHLTKMGVPIILIMSVCACMYVYISIFRSGQRLSQKCSPQLVTNWTFASHDIYLTTNTTITTEKRLMDCCNVASACALGTHLNNNKLIKTTLNKRFLWNYINLV